MNVFRLLQCVRPIFLRDVIRLSRNQLAQLFIHFIINFFLIGIYRINKYISKGAGGASVGLGVRAGYGKRFSVRLDWANVIDSAGAQAKNDQMLNAAVVVQF